MSFSRTIFWGAIFLSSVVCADQHEQIRVKTYELVHLLDDAYGFDENSPQLANSERVPECLSNQVEQLLDWSLAYFKLTQQVTEHYKNTKYYRTGFYVAGFCMLACIASGDYQAMIGSLVLYGAPGLWCGGKLLKNAQEKELQELLNTDLQLPDAFHNQLGVNDRYKEFIKALVHVYDLATGKIEKCDDCDHKDFSKIKAKISASPRKRILGF